VKFNTELICRLFETHTFESRNGNNPPKHFKTNTLMKKHIKNAMAVAFFAASMSVVSAANGAEVTLPVSIDQVGKLKYLVSAEPKSNLYVIILDADNNIIHQEIISSKKLFNLASLVDGKYRMEVQNARKQVVTSKTFNILTEVKRDLVAVQ
jgi:hypothetical protein